MNEPQIIEGRVSSYKHFLINFLFLPRKFVFFVNMYYFMYDIIDYLRESKCDAFLALL